VSKRVALIVDNPYRDLPGLVLVAYRLCHEGVTCYLVPFNLQNNEIWFLNPDFVLLNYLRRNNESLAEILAQIGICFGVLDTEGAVLQSIDSFARTMATDQSVREKTSVFCSWGPGFVEHARSAGWYGADQMAVTGSPRFDYYAAPWREAALGAASGERYCGSDLVLVNGNFPIANPQFQSREAEVEMYVKHFGMNRGEVLAIQQAQECTMTELTGLVNHLAVRFPTVSFVYRPHPFENLSRYKQLLKQLENLHLIKAGTVDAWILRSRTVIQRSCSTAIEAAIAGRPALSPAWIPANVQPLAECVSVQCRSEDDLMQTLQSILEDRFQPCAAIGDRLTHLIEDWFFKIDGKAHERVADCILRSLPDDGASIRLQKCREMAYSGGQTSSRSRLRGRLANALGVSVHWSFRRWADVMRDFSWWDRSEKYFDAQQVRSLVDAIQACSRDGSNSPLRKVNVQSAQERGDYHFGYLQGRSVTISPE